MILPLVVAGGVSAAGSVVFCLFVVVFFLGGGVVELSWLLIFDCPALNVLSKKEHRI